jgi:hypothetical protein
MNKISVIESWSVGMGVFKKNWPILVYALIFPVLVALVVDQFYHVGEIEKGNFSLYYLGPIVLFYVLKFLWDTMFKIGKFRIDLDALDGKKPAYSALFNPKKDYFAFLVLSILLGLSTLGGIIFLIIPGIYVILTYCFAPVLVLDRGVSISESFTRSKEMTVGNRLQMLSYYIPYGLLAFLFLIGSGLEYSIIKNIIINPSNPSLIFSFILILIPLAFVASLLIISNLAIFHLYRQLLDEPASLESEDATDGGQLDFQDIPKDVQN